MSDILAITTHATNDQTLSSFAFVTAVGALAKGKTVAIALLGEGVYLAKREVADSVHGVGFPSLSELIAKVIEANVPVYL